MCFEELNIRKIKQENTQGRCVSSEKCVLALERRRVHDVLFWAKRNEQDLGDAWGGKRRRALC